MSKEKAVEFEIQAALATGRSVFVLDDEGQARLILQVPQQSAILLASKMHELQGVTFWVTFRKRGPG